MPRITVLMAVYNEKGNFLREAIQSILHQTYKDFEFIIVDDGSNTECETILKKYASEDSRIVLVRNKRNLGLTASLNKGIQISQGEFIARLDSNDLSTPERLEKQFTFMERHPTITLCGSWMYIINEDDEIIGKKTSPTEPADIHKRILKYNFFTHSSLFFQKEALLSVGGYSPHMKKAQDYDLVLKLSARYPIANLSEFLGFYRISPTSISEASYKKQEYYAVKARFKALFIYRHPARRFLQILPALFSFLFIPTSFKKLLIQKFL